MIKSAPDYEGKSFRVKPTPRSSVPSAGSWSNRSDKESGLNHSVSEKSVLQRLFHQGNDSTPTSTIPPVPPTNEKLDKFAALVEQHEETAVLSTPNWASKDMALIMHSPGSGEGLNQDLDISGKESVSGLRRNSHVADRRRSSLVSLMSRRDLLDQVDGDQALNISGKDSDSGLQRKNLPTERRRSSLISMMFSLDEDIDEQEYQDSELSQSIRGASSPHRSNLSPLSNSRSPRHTGHSLKQSWKEGLPFHQPLNYQLNSSRHGMNDLNMSGKSMISLGINDLLQAETGTSAITFDEDVAVRRLYLRITNKQTKEILAGENNMNNNNVRGRMEESDLVEVSLLKEEFPSVWDDFYPGTTSTDAADDMSIS